MPHFFSIIIYGPTIERAKTQPIDWVWPSTPHHCFANNNNRQQQIYFCGEFSCPLDFLQILHSHVKNFFNSIVTVLPWEQLKVTPQTEFGILPHTTLPTITGRGGYIFVVIFYVLYNLYWCCITMSQKKIQFISYDPTMGTAETQSADWICPPTLHHHLDNINRQRQVYFCGEFLGPSHFLQIFHSNVAYFFYLNINSPNREWQEHSLQTEFGLPPRTTT
jgi:hypothetical protein